MRTVACVMWSLAALIIVSACTTSRLDERKAGKQPVASEDNGAESTSHKSLTPDHANGVLRFLFFFVDIYVFGR